MRVARILRVLDRRRDWIIDRLSKGAHQSARTFLEEEKRAIECARPILEAELNRRHMALMEQRVDLNSGYEVPA